MYNKQLVVICSELDSYGRQEITISLKVDKENLLTKLHLTNTK